MFKMSSCHKIIFFISKFKHEQIALKIAKPTELSVSSFCESR